MRAKVGEENRCRVCAIPDSVKPLEAAHIIARAHARPGLDWAEHEHNCVPLCRNCHSAYDFRELDLLPFLSREEQAHAVLLAGGIITALERLSGRSLRDSGA
jgi:5-methylcytosine-specific restriction endonuclease McrA